MLLHDPRPRGRLALEASGTDRRHRSLPELAPEFVAEGRLRARRGGPVFVSTHSTDFLNGAEIEEIFSLDQRNGVSTVRRASADGLLRCLTAEGDLPEALRTEGLLTGAGPH